MEHLLTPEKGLIVWTIVTFLGLVAILSKAAWKPLLKTLEEREAKIREDLEAAARAKAQMEQLKSDFDRERLEAEAKTQIMLKQVQNDAIKAREEIVKAAHGEARDILEKTKRQLAEEKERLSKELRQEVSDISIAAAERILRKNLDAKSNERLVEEFLNELPQKKDGGR